MRPHALVSVTFAVALRALTARGQTPSAPVSAGGSSVAPPSSAVAPVSATASGGAAAPSASGSGGPAPSATHVSKEMAARNPAVASAYAAASAEAAAEKWAPSAGELTWARQHPNAAPMRVAPDYDGRRPPGMTAGRGFEWLAQGLFYPVYILTEYGLRRPLGWVVSTAERKQVPAAVINFFTFGENKDSGVVPTAFFDFGVYPSVGVYGWMDHVFARRNSIQAQFGTWGPKWLLLSLRDRWTISGNSYVSAYGTYIRRPDQPFFGLGSRSLQKNFSRYSVHGVEAGLDAWAAVTRQSGVLSRVGIRQRTFSDGDCCGNPGIENFVAQGRFELPPGYQDGYAAVFQRLELVLDNRPRRPAKQTGGRIDFEVEHGTDVNHVKNGAHWVRYGATGGIYADIGRTRTIGLLGTVLMVDPIRGQVPFTEQVTLGGSGQVMAGYVGLMPGYIMNRMIGRSAAAVAVEYRWPIWVFLDGTLQMGVGNVFGEHLEGFGPKLFRLSGAVGVKSNNSADRQLEILTGFGTETLQDGLQVNSFRLVFGGTRGF